MGYKELTSGFEVSMDERGITATQVFIYDPTDQESDSKLPKIGDSLEISSNLSIPGDLGAFPAETVYVTCRRIDFKLLSGHQLKYQWTLQYSNEPIDSVGLEYSGNSQNTNFSNLPINYEYSGEYNLVTPKAEDEVWEFLSDGVSVKQPLPIRVGTSTLRVNRIVSDGNYDAFQRYCQEILGCVNSGGSDGSPFSMNLGCWLFTGVSTEGYRDFQDSKKWRAELNFSFKDPDGEGEDGWQKILRTDSNLKWDVPYNTDPKVIENNSRLYPYADFGPLLTGQ